MVWVRHSLIPCLILLDREINNKNFDSKETYYSVVFQWFFFMNGGERYVMTTRRYGPSSCCTCLCNSISLSFFFSAGKIKGQRKFHSNRNRDTHLPHPPPQKSKPNFITLPHQSISNQIFFLTVFVLSLSKIFLHLLRPLLHGFNRPTSVMKSKNHHLPTPVSNGNTSEGSSPSPPPSPRRQSAAAPHCRRLLRSKTFSQSRRESSVAGIIIRRGLRYFLLLPLFYISGLLMCVGPFSGLVWQSPLPGSVYRSHEIFEKLWHEIESDNFSAIELSSVWRYSRRLKDQKPCPNTSSRHHFAPKYVSPDPSGYLIVEANGGLNQQRSSICNAVAVAGLLNAILVIPHLDFHSVWMDPSEFGDIYDEDHFIRTLKGFVEVVQELPEVVMERYDYNMTNIPNIRIEAWAPVSYYLEEVYPVLRKQGVIRIAPFANRLAMNVPPHVQFLRCFANNIALRFSFPVSTLAKKLVTRMIEKSSRTGGKYVSVHLRFEEDMLAFSCCVYDGGKAERIEMDLVREKGWRGKFSRKGRLIQPGLNRINGKCPLTPLEVGMMLRGMGFDNDTSIYLASGKIYQAERHLDPLRKMFPLLYTKESLATSEELAPFKGYSSRLAALDYTVCLFSEVFVTTQGGNFPHFMMGHRRYLFGGHAKTIQPDKRKLVILLQNMDMSWKAFKNQMESMLIQSDRKGTDVLGPKKSRRKSSIYAYPWPECRCLLESQNSTIKLSPTPLVLDDEAESII